MKKYTSPIAIKVIPVLVLTSFYLSLILSLLAQIIWLFDVYAGQ